MSWGLPQLIWICLKGIHILPLALWHTKHWDQRTWHKPIPCTRHAMATSSQAGRWSKELWLQLLCTLGPLPTCGLPRFFNWLSWNLLLHACPESFLLPQPGEACLV